MPTEVSGQRFTTGWVPQDACTLPSAEQPSRLEEFDHLFATALCSAQRRESTWLQLRFDHTAEIEQHVRDVTLREASCCGFFDFTIEKTGDEIILDVRVPPAREEVLTGIEQQAGSASDHQQVPQ